MAWTRKWLAINPLQIVCYVPGGCLLTAVLEPHLTIRSYMMLGWNNAFEKITEWDKFGRVLLVCFIKQGIKWNFLCFLYNSIICIWPIHLNQRQKVTFILCAVSTIPNLICTQFFVLSVGKFILWKLLPRISRNFTWV